MTAVTEATIQAYLQSESMNPYTALADVLIAETDEWRQKDLKNIITITELKKIPKQMNYNGWVTNRIFQINLYHAQKDAIEQVLAILNKFPYPGPPYSGTPVITTFTEGFETFPFTKWTTTPNCTQVTWPKVSGSYAMKMRGEAGWDPSDAYHNLNTESITTPTTIAFSIDFLSLQPTGYAVFEAYTSLWSKLFSLEFDHTTGKIQTVNDVEGTTVLQTLYAGGWYTIVITLNWTNNSYTVKVDNTTYSTFHWLNYTSLDIIKFLAGDPISNLYVIEAYIDALTVTQRIVPTIYPSADYLDKPLIIYDYIYQDKRRNGMYEWNIFVKSTEYEEVVRT